MRSRVDGRGRLPRELLERDHGVLTAAQAFRASLDEVAHQRPVLVERGACLALVLLECERQGLACVVELAHEIGEPAERERAQGVMELRRAWSHDDTYSARPPIPPPAGARGPRWQEAH